MKKKLLIPIALILIAAAIGIWSQFGKNTPEAQYRFETLEKGELVQTVSANGTINPVSLVNVGTQVSGKVRKLYVDFNDKVEKDQVLLELDDDLLAAQLKQSRANLESARAALELANANAKRMRDLYAQEYVSRQELDVAVREKKAAEAQLQQALAVVEKDSANLSYAVIRSPVSGVVVERAVDAGQTVAASLQTPTLFKIAQDLSKMQIDANFAEADIGGIRAGQTAHFTVDAFPNRSFDGKVRQVRINPITQQNVVTYDVVIDVDNPEQLLIPGMTTYVTIAVAERKEALLVPNAALRFRPADTAAKKENGTNGAHKAKRDGFTGKVYVLKDGKPAPVEVALGISDGRNTEVTGGELKPGERVITGDTQAAGSTATSSGPPRMRMF